MTQPSNRQAFWRNHYDRCREQGMTLKGYAEQEGLTVSVFYSWSKRFRKEQHPTMSAFSRVRMAPSGGIGGYRLHLPNGLVLEWEGTPDSTDLARLVNALT